MQTFMRSGRGLEEVAGVALWALGFLVSGCGSGAPARSPALDPSNPDAAESPSSAPAFAMRATAPLQAQPSAAPTAPAPVSSAPAASASATVYTCPMHPEVTSDKPDRCPKCGMKLVPKAKTQAAPAASP